MIYKQLCCFSCLLLLLLSGCRVTRHRSKEAIYQGMSVKDARILLTKHRLKLKASLSYPNSDQPATRYKRYIVNVPDSRAALCLIASFTSGRSQDCYISTIYWCGYGGITPYPQSTAQETKHFSVKTVPVSDIKNGIINLTNKKASSPRSKKAQATAADSKKTKTPFIIINSAKGKPFELSSQFHNYFTIVKNAEFADLTGLAPGSKMALDKQKSLVTQGLPLEIRTNKTGIHFRLIPPGSFMMGTPEKPGRKRNECYHKVVISQPFYLAKYEITQSQWEQVMNNIPANGQHLPIENVCWYDCQNFIAQLCTVESLPKDTFSLPTEAEWEYACRAGTQTPFYFGNILLKSEANYNKRFYGVCRPKASSGMTTPVGTFAPNAFGLYDMHGNLEEWCEDWDWDTGVGTHPCRTMKNAKDPKGAISGKQRVIKGGDWYDYMTTCRSASRRSSSPNGESSKCGFRLMLPIIRTE